MPPPSAPGAGSEPGPASPVGVADELAKLQRLVDQGTITPTQFEAQKQKLLGG
jgi:hypothetical protein